jgi:hypothetical protein
MKHIINLILLIIFSFSELLGQVGIGTNSPHVKSILELRSESKGFLPPRMVASQRDAIASPPTGLTIWCSDCGSYGELQVYNGNSWKNAIGSTASSIVFSSQLGSTINGESAGDESGRAISLKSDGSILAIGAIYNDDRGSNSGHVRVYSWGGASWTKMGSDVIGAAAGDQYGFSVSLSTGLGLMAVGAPYNDEGGTDAGQATVHFWNGAGFDGIYSSAKFNGEASGDLFGHSVSLSNDGRTLAVGAPNNDQFGSNSGNVRVFQLNSGDVWERKGNDIDGEVANDRFGYSTAISSNGNVVAIGAIKPDGNGYVKVFDWSGSSWTQRGATIVGEASADHFGWSVSLSSNGNRVAVGATGNDGNGTSSGHVRVFEWSGSAWAQMGNDIDGESANDGSGYSISMSADGSRISVGAPNNSGNGINSGHIRYYVWNESTWVKWGNDKDGSGADVLFGSSVSLSSDGTIMASGSPGNVGGSAGSVSVYR